MCKTLTNQTKKSGSLEKNISKIDNRLFTLSSSFNTIVNSHIFIKWTVLFLYILSLSIISYFHEPWGDEAQAWVIARDCSIKELIFEIGHLEGHPPLWWLYLSIFAKTGMPYELGLKLAAIIINSIAAFLIIFKAPFHCIFNFTIPFTYFLFYQYGVISRCYSFLILGFVLCGIYYNQKSKKPFKMIFSLLLLCMSGAYGLIFAFGIALIWVYELIISNIKQKKSFINIIINNLTQLSALFILLIIALFIVYQMIPYKNTSGTYIDVTNSIYFRLFYTFFLLPADSIVYSSYWGEAYLGIYEITPPVMIMGSIIWIIILLALITRKEAYGKIKLFIVPYIIFSIICANLYMYSHHIGIFALFILFWLWTCFDQNYDQEKITKCKTPRHINWLTEGEGKLLYNTEWIIFCFMIIISISWSISSSYEDIVHNYVDARETHSFLKEYNLENAKIMKPGTFYTINEKQRYELPITSIPLITAYLPVQNNTYRSLYKNKPANWVVRSLFITDNDPDEKSLISYWQSLGYPDITIGECDLSYIYDKSYQEIYGKIPDYICVKKIPFCIIFKGYYLSLGDYSCTKIYMRKDMAYNLNLTEIK